MGFIFLTIWVLFWLIGRAEMRCEGDAIGHAFSRMRGVSLRFLFSTKEANPESSTRRQY